MAFGFTPKHVEDFPLNDLTQQQFLVLANESARKVGWQISYLSDNGLIGYTDNGMFSTDAEIKIKIEDGIATIRSASIGSELMDWGRNKKNIANFISTFEALKPTLTKEELNVKYLALNDQLVSPEDDLLKLHRGSTNEENSGFFSIFKPTQGFFVTPILLDINVLIFILMAMSGVNILQPTSESLLNWGANFKPMTLDGEWWRLIANCFLHIGIFHLLMNMYALLYIGVLLEPHLGRTRFILAYLLTGITASIASLWWNDLTISAGASGAIFGMYGVFLAMLTTNLIEKTARKALLMSIVIFVGYNLVNGVKEGIDNAAHIGGLIGGLVIGYAFIPSLRKPEEERLKFGTIGLLSIVILVFSFVVYKKLPNDIGIYDSKIKDFVSMEEMALDVFNLPSNTPNDKILYGIKDKGIHYWNENIKLLESFNDLELPVEIRTRNKLLKEYCELRIKSYELLYKTISEDTNQYQSQLENYNKLIEAKVKELSAVQQDE